MADKVKAVPEGFHTLTPHLTVRDARRAIDFYQKAFGAEVLASLMVSKERSCMLLSRSAIPCSC
jgi:uncharacterized glyoxalase superfamily protein PhnB